VINVLAVAWVIGFHRGTCLWSDRITQAQAVLQVDLFATVQCVVMKVVHFKKFQSERVL
jgi:TolB-like protein